MSDPRLMSEGEARTALTMYRLVLRYTRGVLSGWDYQGKQAREFLIHVLDTVEDELETMLAKPEGDGSTLNASIKYLSEQMAVLEKQLAEAGIR